METARLFQEYQVEFNILTVVTAQSSKRIKRIYQYFGEQGFTYQQYIPCIDPFEENKGSLSYSLTPDRYGKFLKDLFDYWYQDWKDGIRYITVPLKTGSECCSIILRNPAI